LRWTIDKQFDFCYGHRVWSQKLDSEYSIDGSLSCRHLHGHQGVIKIDLSTEQLAGSMVTDFKHLNWFKQWLENTLDHKFIIDKNDPLFADMFSHYCTDANMNKEQFIYHDEGHWTPDLSVVSDEIDAIVEKYEGMVIVDFVPTSENISAWILTIVQKKMDKLGVNVSAVQFWETPKSHCEVRS